CAVVEQEHEGERAKPRLHLCIVGDRAEVGPVPAPPQPDLGERARPPLPHLLRGPPGAHLLEDAEQQQVMVAEDGAAVAASARHARRLGATAVTGGTTPEEVAEE